MLGRNGGRLAEGVATEEIAVLSKIGSAFKSVRRRITVSPAASFRGEICAKDLLIDPNLCKELPWDIVLTVSLMLAKFALANFCFLNLT